MGNNKLNKIKIIGILISKHLGNASFIKWKSWREVINLLEERFDELVKEEDKQTCPNCGKEIN